MVRALALLTWVAVAVTTVRPARADDQPSPSQKASIFAKASVVRVLGYWEVSFRVGNQTVKEYVGGMGSGFFATGNGYVVTNAHVVADIKAGENAAKEKAYRTVLQKLDQQYAAQIARMSDDQKHELARDIASSVNATAHADIVLPDGSTKPYKVVAFGKPGEGTDVAVIKVDLKDAPNLPIAESDNVQVQDKVLAIGYPGAADMQGLLDAKSQLEATINDGAVSALKHTSDGDPIIQISASITHGNSGGPTINMKGEVIGLSTFGSKGEVQGFNFIVASDTVAKFLKKAKANTKPSETIKTWRKGLDEWWDGDLDKSIVDLEEVATLFPSHSEAPRVLKQVRQMKKEGKGKKSAKGGDSSDAGGSSNTAGIVVAIVVVVVILIGVLILASKSKNKTARPPGMAPGMTPGMSAPGMPPNMMAPNASAPGMPPPAYPPPGGPAPGPPHNPAMMTPGQTGPTPVAKTMAIGQGQQSHPVAATAFGSLTLASLTCTRGQLSGQRFGLTPQGLLIGRQPGVAQIVINDSRASGKHVWIGYENGVLVAIDQGTTNGTYINDVRNGRISKAPLKDGDVVIVGEPDCLSLTLKLS